MGCGRLCSEASTEFAVGDSIPGLQYEGVLRVWSRRRSGSRVNVKQRFEFVLAGASDLEPRKGCRGSGVWERVRFRMRVRRFGLRGGRRVMATELRQRTSSDGGLAEDSVVRICVVFDDYCGSRGVFGSWAGGGCRCRGFNVIDRDPICSLPYIGAFTDAYQIRDRRF